MHQKRLAIVNFLVLLKNKNILITGGGKEIGFSAILEAIKESAFVCAIIKSKKDLKIYRMLNHIMEIY